MSTPALSLPSPQPRSGCEYDSGAGRGGERTSQRPGFGQGRRAGSSASAEASSSCPALPWAPEVQPHGSLPHGLSPESLAQLVTFSQGSLLSVTEQLRIRTSAHGRGRRSAVQTAGIRGTGSPGRFPQVLSQLQVGLTAYPRASSHVPWEPRPGLPELRRVPAAGRPGAPGFPASGSGGPGPPAPPV